MRRRVAAVVAVVGALLVSGCTQQYATPDERSHAVGEAVAESLRDVEPQPADLSVRGGFDGIVLEADLADLSPSETRDFIEAALPVMEESPLGAMPARLIFRHDDSRSGGGVLEWRGYDPERSERYFAAVQLWLDVLADPGAKVKQKFEVEATTVYGAVEVFDDRDLDAYRAQLEAALEQAGYVEPSLEVTPADRPAAP